MKTMPLPGYLCPACHTGDHKPVIRVTLDDEQGVWVHEDCHREVVEARQQVNDKSRRMTAWHN